MSQTHTPNRPLLRIFAVLLVELIGFGLIIPVIPYFAEGMGADSVLVGLLFAAQYAGQFLTAPLWGGLSDRVGRKPVMIVTVALAAVASLLTALSGNLWALFGARIFAGLAAGNISTASAYVTDVTSEEDRSKGMAVIGISFALGFTVGPGLGAWLSGYGPQVPFLVSVGISAVNAVLAAVILREPPHAPQPKKGRGELWRMIQAQPTTRVMCGLNLWYTVALSFLEVPFAFYLASQFQRGTGTYGALMSGLGVVMILVQGGLVRRLSKKVGDVSMGMVGLGVLAVGMMAAPAVQNLAWLVVMLVVASLGRGLAQPGMQAVASKSAKPGEAGLVMGAFQAAASLGRVFGPALGGFIYRLHPPALFWSAGAILAVCLGAWWSQRRAFVR